MKHTIKYFLLLFIFKSSLSYSQTIDYAFKQLDTPACNTFAHARVVDGFTHRTSLSRPVYNDNSIKLECKNNNSTSIFSTQYSINYNFKVGYNYKISVNYLGAKAASDGFFPSVGLKISTTNGGIDSGVNCTSASTFQTSNMAGFTLGASGSSYAWAINLVDVTITQNASYLLVGAFPWAGTSQNGFIWIRKIQIVETPPPFTLTPSSLSVPCGSATTQTFTVNNVNNVPGTLSYNWNLGSSANGWIYGSNNPAPQTFTTSTNSISLTSSTTATSLSNVSVTVNHNGANISTLTSNVTLTTPGANYTFLGPLTPCTNSLNTYTLGQTPPSGTTVTWSIYPDDGSIILNPTGNSVEVDVTNATLNAPYTLTATITGPCYLGIGTRQFSIPAQAWAGGITGYQGWQNPVYNGNLVEGDNYLYTGGGATWFEALLGGYGNTTWSDTWWEYISGDYTPYTHAYAGSYWIGYDLQYYYLDSYYSFHYTDECGSHAVQFHFMNSFSSPPSYRTQQPKELYKLKISPNPASSFVNISVVEIESNKKADSKVFDYNSQKIVKVYDKLGNLLIQRNELIPKSGLRLNVSMLKSSDIYNIIVEDRSGSRLSGKFIKQ